MTISADLCLLYMTAPDGAVAERLVRGMVEARLVACGNILPAHTAVYRWEGKVETAPEVGVILKTRSALAPAVADFVAANHPYDIPALVQIPVSGGLPAFLDWVRAETVS